MHCKNLLLAISFFALLALLVLVAKSGFVDWPTLLSQLFFLGSLGGFVWLDLRERPDDDPVKAFFLQFTARERD